MRNILPLFFIIPVATFATGGTMAGSGTAADPWQVADYEDLKKVGESPYTMDGHYRLVKDIDAGASKTETFPDEGDATISGFKPIGMILPSKIALLDSSEKKWSVPFTGTFNGGGHKISNLEIVHFVEPSTGLFSALDSSARLDSLTLKAYFFKGIYSGGVAGINRGTINEVHVDTDTLDFVTSAAGIVSENYGTITNSSFSGTILGAYLGGIAYDNRGLISHCETVIKNGGADRQAAMFGGIAYKNSGTITDCKTSGEIAATVNIGGIASMNFGTVKSCSSSVDIYGAGGTTFEGLDVNSVGALGGLVAIDSGKILNSHASGDVVGTANNVGGFVGIAFGEISGCSASGTVKGVAFSGAFVATNRGKIDSSFASGQIIGSAYMGGFAGYNFGEIINSHALGNVDAASASGGGFVARNEATGVIENCYATGNVNCYVYTGGFAGENTGKISGSHSSGHAQGSLHIGGFLGKQEGGSTEKSYSTGYVMGEIAVGGFAGDVVNSTLDQCYSTGDVLNGEIQTAGFVPVVRNSTVSNSFSTGNVYSTDESFEQTGSFVAFVDSTSMIKNSFSMGAISNSAAQVDKVCAMSMVDNVDGYYWNISNCTVVDSADYGIALTSEQMKSSASFDKFDFEKLWEFRSGAIFPTLKEVVFDTTKKDSTGFFGSEIERYVPSDVKDPGNVKDPGKTDINRKSVTVARPVVSFSCRYVQGSVQMTFAVPRSGMVEIRIVDFQGREVGAVPKRSYGAGNAEVRWDASGLKKGRYLAVLRVDGKIVAKSGFVKAR